MAFGGTSAATVFVDVEGDLTKFKKDVSGAADHTKKEMSGAFGKAAKVGGTALAVGAAGILAKGVSTFVDFEKGITEVFTLIPDASAAVRDQLTEDAKTITKAFGTPLTEVTSAMYDSISAGVNEADVFRFLQTANQLAIGGVTELGVAVDALTGVTNAYTDGSVDASKASDILFGTVKAGKTTIAELGANIANVTPVAADIGVSFEQVGASIASITAVTGNTATASTQLRAVFSELGKDGSKAFKAFEASAGKTFRTFVEEGGTVSEGLIMMEQHAAETGIELSDMFGSVEAGGAALIIAGEGGAKFNDTLAELQDGAGATGEAYLEMRNTLGAAMDRVKGQLSVAALEIGTALAPTLISLADAIEPISRLLSELPGPLLAAAVAGLGFAGALIALSGPILRTIQIMRLLNLSFLANPWVLLIVAVVALAYIIYKNWDTIKETILGAWQGIKDGTADLVESLGRAWDSVIEKIQPFLDLLQTIWSFAFNAMSTFFETWTGRLQALWTNFTNWISTAFLTIAAILLPIWQALWGAIMAVVNVVWPIIQIDQLGRRGFHNDRRRRSSRAVRSSRRSHEYAQGYGGHGLRRNQGSDRRRGGLGSREGDDHEGSRRGSSRSGR